MLEVSLSDFVKVKKFLTEAQEGTMKKVLKLMLVKSTRGTHVYANGDEGISGFYIPKAFFPLNQPTPMYVKVTIEAWKEEA